MKPSRPASRSSRPKRSAAPASVNRRARTVWGVFLAAMTGACGLLLLADGSRGEQVALPMLGPGVAIGGSSDSALFETRVPIDSGRWGGIVIHHSGGPAGDATTLHRQHVSHGLDGLGYHFVIGNGSGMSEGEVAIGYRWAEQLPGAHALGPDASWHNQHSIAICLVGNGESRAFTDHQIESLVRLVRDLQRRFGIPAERVWLHREVASVRSPGRFFPEAAFRERLLPLPR
ncbi:MAG: N-acetylmuramoyl-L-alanine amidase [Phycisphaeraceae bacterium]|nr:MAG: N-acetylmuramoyl-L-alanine amidase [Phycisphaeraceae bacterium]